MKFQEAFKTTTQGTFKNINRNKFGKPKYKEICSEILQETPLIPNIM